MTETDDESRRKTAVFVTKTGLLHWSGSPGEMGRGSGRGYFGPITSTAMPLTQKIQDILRCLDINTGFLHQSEFTGWQFKTSFMKDQNESCFNANSILLGAPLLHPFCLGRPWAIKYGLSRKGEGM